VSEIATEPPAPVCPPRVDFAFGASDKWRAACTTLARHFEAGHSVVVYCSQADVLQQFDLLLWGFDPAAFIPHVMADDPLAARTPIILTDAPLEPDAANKPQAWLLNLDSHCPPMMGQYPRILEVVSQTETDTAAARVRWRHYQQQGCTLRSHDLRAQFQPQQ